MPSFSYGGQALVEGVLMRGRGAIAVALRHPGGGIVTASERLDTGFRRTRWARLPLVRGLVVLYETLVTGTRWLIRSAGVNATGEGVEIGKGTIALMLVLTLAIGIGLFFFLPFFLTRVVVGSQPGLLEHAIEGSFQVAIFIGYLLLIGRAGDVRRTFQYHGAEHMAIHALEAGDPLTTAAVRRYPTAHPRCGTEFLVVVIMLSIFTFALVGRQSIPLTIATRALLIPAIAAVSYEILRFGARHRQHRLVRWLTMPGIWVQMITTRQPTDDMIEVAIVSLERALEADGHAVPEGSTEFAWEPLEVAEARHRAELAVATVTGSNPSETTIGEPEPTAPAAADDR